MEQIKSNGKIKRRSPWYDAWVRLRKNKSAVIGMIILVVWLLALFTSPLYISYEEDVIKPDIGNRNKFPAEGTLLGTDELGRDIFARIMWGGRISVTLGFASVVISMVLGSILGIIASYYGGRLDSIIMRCLDIFMAIPSTLLMITLVSVMKPTITNLIFAMSIGSIPGQARMIRAQVYSVKNLEYIDAVRVQGASDLRIILSHILPNAISPLISQYLMGIAGGIMAIAGLSFIGLGVQPPDPEWGAMLSTGRATIRDVWHTTAFPGIAIVITVVCLTLLGDGLRDALDPRMKR